MAKIPLNKKSAVILAPFVPTKRLALVSIFNATNAYNVDECKKTTNFLTSSASKQTRRAVEIIKKDKMEFLLL